MKNITIILFIIFIIFMALFFNFKNNNLKNNTEKNKITKQLVNDESYKKYSYTTLKLKNTDIKLYIADNDLKKQKGLMNVSKLDANEGMIFLFDHESKATFWMKNTLIPLDIIWVNKDMKIVDIKENAQPCDSNQCPFIYPADISKYVIELNSGYTKKHSIKVGDILDIDLNNN